MFHGTNKAFSDFVGELELGTAFVKDGMNDFMEQCLLGIVGRQLAADPDDAGSEVA